MAEQTDLADGAAPRRPLVLVVEDESVLAMDVEDALAAAGYDVAWASDGHSALATATAAPPGRLAAAVVNLGLPPGGPRGQEVVRALRALVTPAGRRPLPVVVATGYGPEAPQANLRGLGGPTERLGKPVARADLLARLAEVLARGPDYSGPDRRRRGAGGAGPAAPRVV